MDYLLQNLHDQELHLQKVHFTIHDLLKMEKIDGEPPLSPPKKFVSVFRIDGEPILPPLMTAEKREEMKKLKKMAILIDQRLSKHNQRDNSNNDQRIKNTKIDVHFPKCLDNSTQQSLSKDDYMLKESAESVELLNKIIKRQQEEDECLETRRNVSDSAIVFGRLTEGEKLKKLGKSETIIFDNSKNELIKKIPKENGEILAVNLQKQLNIDNAPNKQPSYLLLSGTNAKGIATIPSICLNPPTPLMTDKTLSGTLSGSEFTDSPITSVLPSQSLDFSYEFSSDESCNSIIPHADITPHGINRRNYVSVENRDESSKNAKENYPVPGKSVCAKIQQFEAINSDTSSPKTSNEKLCKNKKLCLGTLSGSMNRSATSPSLKINAKYSSPSSRSQSLAQDSDNSPECNLVRSSSFTLETPSKALIEHMQQQKTINENKTGTKYDSNRNHKLIGKLTNSPIRAHRDTVESKAKKVQKMESKPSKPKNQQKLTQSKFAQAASASTSPYSAKNSNLQPNFISKKKRSPSHTSPQNVQKPICSQIRKPNPTSFCITENKISKTRLASLSSTSGSCNSRRTTPNANASLNHAEINKKVHLLQLLAQQEEEHRNLQKAFELQQKILIEQLSRELVAARLKSSNDSQHSSPKTPISHIKQFVEQQTLPPKKFNYDNALSTPTAPPSDLKRLNTRTAQYPSPHSISSNSSYIAFDNNNRHSQNPSYDSNFTQTKQPNPVNNSHLMDHSSVNNSLLKHTSPDTPLIQNNTAKNSTFNKTTPSFCRRLFAAEINSETDEENVLCTHTAVSTSCAKTQNSMEPKNQPRALDCYSNISVSEYNTLVLHAAATKINAYARGFLVRRLFKTEEIQRIVQTIRDTLIFVLNLHIETVENPEESMTPANIKLKARLLQQLTSACRTLHLVFFEMSMKERMEIIVRDRKRIKHKLITINHKR